MGAGKSEIHRARLGTGVRADVAVLSLKAGNSGGISTLQSGSRAPFSSGNLSLCS